MLAIYNAGAALFTLGNSRVSMLIAGLINIVNLIGNSIHDLRPQMGRCRCGDLVCYLARHGGGR